MKIFFIIFLLFLLFLLFRMLYVRYTRESKLDEAYSRRADAQDDVDAHIIEEEIAELREQINYEDQK